MIQRRWQHRSLPRKTSPNLRDSARSSRVRHQLRHRLRRARKLTMGDLCRARPVWRAREPSHGSNGRSQEVLRAGRSRWYFQVHCRSRRHRTECQPRTMSSRHETRLQPHWAHAIRPGFVKQQTGGLATLLTGEAKKTRQVATTLHLGEGFFLACRERLRRSRTELEVQDDLKALYQMSHLAMALYEAA